VQGRTHRCTLPGDADTFPELAGGDVLETQKVSRSDGEAGYWISPAKTGNIQENLTKSDSRHGEAFESLLEKNAVVLRDFPVGI
jgi:hypothetical protein